MKQLGIVLGLVFGLAAVGSAWMPAYIMNSAQDQGSNSVINISSGTIDTVTVTSMDFSGATEAVLKTSTPTVVGQIIYDTTNSAVIITTGTATCFDYGLIYDGTTVPTGW